MIEIAVPRFGVGKPPSGKILIRRIVSDYTGTLSSQLRASSVSGWLHLQQVDRSVVELSGGRESIESGADPSAICFRHAPQLRRRYKYELPLDRVFRHQTPWTQGWSVFGLTRFATGIPVTLYNNNDTSLLGTIPNGINNNGIDTPNVTVGKLELNTNPRNGRFAFNIALFSLPALGEMGNATRRFFAGAGMNNVDMALEKDVRFAESKSLEIRLEAFNVFNHAQFYGPAAVNGNISSANFGQVVSAAAPRLVQLAAKLSFQRSAFCLRRE